MQSLLRSAKEGVKRGVRAYSSGGAALELPSGGVAPEVLFPRPSGQGFMRDADGRIFGPRFPFNYPPSAGYYDGWGAAFNGSGAGGEHWLLAYLTWIYPFPVMYMYYADKAKREAAEDKVQGHGRSEKKH